MIHNERDASLDKRMMDKCITIILFLKMTYYCIIYNHTLKFYKYYIHGYITIRFLIHLINSYHIFIEKKRKSENIQNNI